MNKKKRQQYENQPNARRGVSIAYQKLIRPNPTYNSLLDEMDVEVKDFGPKDYRLSANGEPVFEGTYKDKARAKNALYDYVKKMIEESDWKMMNGHKVFNK